MPEVSYILTTKDRPEQARSFLKNLQALKRDGDEVIIVDASDEPYSVDIFGDIATKLIIEPDTSIRHGLNKGILASTKPYIKLLMDDDWFVPDATHRAFSIMEEHGIHAMQAGGKRWREPEHPPHIGMYDCLPGGFRWGEKPADVVNTGSTGVGQFFSREAFAIGGIIDTRILLWDMEIMARMIDSGANVKYCRLYSYEHPLTPESTLGNTDKFENKRVKEVMWMRQRYGFDINVILGQAWKNMTCEEANYDGGFS